MYGGDIGRMGDVEMSNMVKCVLCGRPAVPYLVDHDMMLCFGCHQKVLSEIFSIELDIRVDVV